MDMDPVAVGAEGGHHADAVGVRALADPPAGVGVPQREHSWTDGEEPPGIGRPGVRPHGAAGPRRCGPSSGPGVHEPQALSGGPGDRASIGRGEREIQLSLHRGGGLPGGQEGTPHQIPCHQLALEEGCHVHSPVVGGEPGIEDRVTASLQPAQLGPRVGVPDGRAAVRGREQHRTVVGVLDSGIACGAVERGSPGVQGRGVEEQDPVPGTDGQGRPVRADGQIRRSVGADAATKSSAGGGRRRRRTRAGVAARSWR